MAITGNLVDFSLPELFQFLEQGQKTGRLTINGLPDTDTRTSLVHHLWLHQGRVVAAADRLDGKGLVSMIDRRGWLSDRVAYRVAQVCPINTPIGLCLKSQGLLQPEQLKMLFRIQVLGQVCKLFQRKDGKFEFNQEKVLPLMEMTGLSLAATEATLMGLRALQNWSVLVDKLPDPTSGLSSATTGQPPMRLDSQEWQVWEFVNGNISLREVAEAVALPVEKVQQIAFRLIVAGLAEEFFMTSAPIPHKEERTSIVSESSEQIQETNKPNISQPFFNNLVSFLRSKA